MNSKKKIEYVNLVYPYDRPGPRPDAKGTKIENSSYDRLREFNHASHSVPNIRKINWHDIVAVKLSRHGNNKVIFVETQDGSFVLKGSLDPALEYFYSVMLQSFYMPTPKMRIIPYSDAEFKVMVEMLERATFKNPALYSGIQNRLNRPFILLMQYIPGIHFTDMSHKRADRALNPRHPKCRRRLLQMGILTAIDIFMNNPDRLPMPFIWGEYIKGNTSNLLFKMETVIMTTNEELFDRDNVSLVFEDIYAFDSRPVTIKAVNPQSSQAIMDYYKKFDKLLEHIFTELREIMKAHNNVLDVDLSYRIDIVHPISKLFEDECSYDIDGIGDFNLLLGLALGFYNIYHFGINRFELLKKQLQQVIQVDFKDIWKENSELVDTEFFQDMIYTIRRCLMKYDDVMNWTKAVTLNQFSFKFDLRVNDIFEEIEEQKIKDEIKKMEEEERNKDKLTQKLLTLMPWEITDAELLKKLEEVFHLNYDAVKDDMEKKKQILLEEQRKKEEEEKLRIKLELEEKMRQEEEQRKLEEEKKKNKQKKKQKKTIKNQKDFLEGKKKNKLNNISNKISLFFFYYFIIEHTFVL